MAALRPGKQKLPHVKLTQMRKPPVLQASSRCILDPTAGHGLEMAQTACCTSEGCLEPIFTASMVDAPPGIVMQSLQAWLRYAADSRGLVNSQHADHLLAVAHTHLVFRGLCSLGHSLCGQLALDSMTVDLVDGLV